MKLILKNIKSLISFFKKLLEKPGTAVILIKDNSKLVAMVSIGIEKVVKLHYFSDINK